MCTPTCGSRQFLGGTRGEGVPPLVVGHPSTVPHSILTRGVLTPPPSPPYIDARLASVAILTHPPNAHP